MFVPVKTNDGQQLMPMHAARARKLVKRGEATPYWNNALNKEPSDRVRHCCRCPGSKKEGFTVKSATTYLNVRQMHITKLERRLRKDVNSAEGEDVLGTSDVLGSVPTARTAPTKVRTDRNSPQAPGPVGIGNSASWIGCLTCILSQKSVWRTSRQEQNRVRSDGTQLLVRWRLVNAGLSLS